MMHTAGSKKSQIQFIKQKAREIRIDIVKMTAKAGSGHPGGSLSSADIVAALYFGDVLRVKHDEPDWPDRDRFVLSKGHAAPVLYSALARRGFFPEEWLDTLRQLGSPLQGHPDCKRVPGVEVSTGSLGQGLSMAVGMALAGKLDRKDYNVWVLLGDGECQEGQVWEAAMAASHYKLDNLIAIVDNNGLQIDGKVEEVMGVSPIDDKFKAFSWHVFRVDGHKVDLLMDVFRQALDVKGKPAVIVADTVKGKGVSFMEGEKDWHGKTPNAGQLEEALEQLEAI